MGMFYDLVVVWGLDKDGPSQFLILSKRKLAEQNCA